MSIKKTIITTLVALALVAVVAPVGAKADQISDLMAQLNALTAQLNALQAVHSNTQVGTGFCTGVTFTRTLNVGSTGSDVKCLQSILNSTGISQTVTGTFGSHTLAGVKTFQIKYGITASGNVGPLTRAQLTIALGTVTPAPAPAATLCPNGTTIASNCTLLPNAQAPAALCPNGNTLASNCQTAQASTATGTTGFISLADIAATPASNANVTQTSNVPVLGLDLKAIGSNMTVNSAKVQLAVTRTDTGATQYPSTVVENLYVYDGSTLLGTFPVNSSTIVTDNSVSPNVYYVILSGFNFNIPGNTTKTLTINADFVPSLDTSRALVVGLYPSNSIRATDASGAYSSVNGVANERNYTITYSTVATSILTVAQDTATTLSASVNVNTTSGTNNVPALVFDAKSTTGASNITNLKFTVTGDDAAVAKTTAVELFDGSTLIGSQSLSSAVSGATASFNNLNIAVAQDATKVLTAEVNVGSGVTNGTGIIVSIANPSTDVTYQQPNMSSVGATTSSAVTGNEQYFFNGATADLSFQNASSVYTYNSQTPSLSYTTGVITFNAKADGGTMTALTNSTIEVSANYGGSTHILSSGNVNVDFAPVGGTDNANLSDGGTAVVTVNVTLPRATSGTGFINFYIDKVTWTVGASSGIQQTWLSNYKTPFANVQ